MNMQKVGESMYDFNLDCKMFSSCGVVGGGNADSWNCSIQGVFLSNFSFSEHQLGTLFLNVHGNVVCNFTFVYVRE